MENLNNNDNQENIKEAEFKLFAFKRIIVGVLLTVVVLWVVGAVMGFFDKPGKEKAAVKHAVETPASGTAHKSTTESAHQETPAAGHMAAGEKPEYKEGTAGHIMSTDFVAMGMETPAGEVIEVLKKKHRNIRQPFHLYVVNAHDQLQGMVSLKQLMFADAHTLLKNVMTTNINSVTADTKEEKVAELIARFNIFTVPVIDNSKKLLGVIKADDVVDVVKIEHLAAAPEHKKAEVKEPVHKSESHGIEAASAAKQRPKGVAFIEALIKPLSHELHERFWGWRPNDVLNFTDNINNFQLGVLEVTRRASVILAERISRTGTTAAFAKNLENSMNWFMIKSDRYWFPSPESKYSAGLKELEIYKAKLEKGEAKFYTRTDNLIPLLAAFEDLLGSCDENLVKQVEDDGTPVSFFKADDYFFYAKGVTSAMYTILEAILEDFHTTIDSRRGLEVLHHAIESCHHAIEIHPLLITNSSWSGILANHRANMAAPVSHARFYLGVLIKTLST